ncbi:hypothetical protein ACFXDJ_14445 [Streptomyces sp. NPDC059443]|uniref:hypothetical protein n=1 Tax=unclassified Streptomyces TaxID=2593676 RepID=UPI0036C8C8D1
MNATAADEASMDVLYTAELVNDCGTYKLIVRDLAHGTLQSVTVPRRTVGKIPMYLSMVGLQWC